jgi:hypothetical protein
VQTTTVIRGAGRYAHLRAPSTITNQKAILVISGDNTVIENIEFSDATVPDKNGAGIRLEGRNITISHCYFHDCEDGILGGSGTVTVAYSEFGNCGYGDGYNHNMYISACDTFTLQFCYTHDASEGHTIKSRARVNRILCNRIESAQSTTSYEINLPNGGTSFIIGNQVQQGANSHNSAIIDYGSEGISEHDSSLYVVSNTIVNDRGSGTFISVRSTGKRPKVYNNIFAGTGTICTIAMDSAGNWIGSDPGFLDRTLFDYHLDETSPARGSAVDPGTVGTFRLMPAKEYVHPLSGRQRLDSGAPVDVGAYAYTDESDVITRRSANVRFPQIPEGPAGRYDLMGRRYTGNYWLPVQVTGNTGSRRLYKFRVLIENEE